VLRAVNTGGIRRTTSWRPPRSPRRDKISHIDMGDDHIDTVISHIISPYSIFHIDIQDDHIDTADNHIDILVPYPRSIIMYHIDIPIISH